MNIPFSKYSGCGNDFILIDNRQKIFEVHNPEDIARLCDRRLGIGADGVILLEHSFAADFRMRIYNADGSEAEMCGNGIRCIARFLHELSIPTDSFLIETMHQKVHVSLSENMVSVNMPNPTQLNYFKPIIVEESSFIVHHLDTGVPHSVLFVDNIEDESLMRIAPKIRYHSYFKPKGTNVNFALLTQSDEIIIRTYERGVEGETLACGTGAVAVAIVAAVVYNLKSPLSIRTRSKDILQISFVGTQPMPTNIVMKGPAIKIYQGTFKPNTVVSRQ